MSPSEAHLLWGGGGEVEKKKKNHLGVKHSAAQMVLFAFFGLGTEEGCGCCFAFLFQKDSYYVIMSFSLKEQLMLIGMF